MKSLKTAFLKLILNIPNPLCSLLLILLVVCSAQAKDIVTITSDRSAVVNKTKGTAVWQKNVHVIRQSSGSNMDTDRLSIEREPVSKRIVWAEALGNVKAAYFRIPEDSATGVSDPKTVKGFVLHTTASCDLATFSRKTFLAILTGDVNVRSIDGNLEAEKIVYNYKTKRGKITPRPGEQVRFVVYKKADSTGEEAAVRPESRKISGVANEILVDRSSRKSVLQGSVFIKDHSDQSEFKADRAEIFFDEKEEIETIIASGNFSMKQPKRFSKADRALFEYETEEVTLIGNAYVKESDDVEVSSARIKMYMKVNKGIISGVDDIPVKMKIEID